jgi:inorganic pyrophosphatase
MSIRDYLESEPFFEIQRYKSGPPQDAVAFVGTPRKHPYDDGKLVLVGDTAAENPGIYEFLVGDVVHAEDLASPVMENGESYRGCAFGYAAEAWESGTSRSRWIPRRVFSAYPRT